MKNTMKRMLSLALALMMCLSVAVPTFAADATCPGKDEEHVKANCSYTFIEKHEPTCEKQGFTAYKCNTCGDYFADDIVKVTGKCEWVVVKEPTCGADGVKKCSVCGDEAAVAKTTDHNYEVTTEPTCEADGEKTCTVCGATAKVDKGAHKYVYDRDVNVCYLPGEKANGECAICGAKITVDLGTHDYGTVPSKIVKEPARVPCDLVGKNAEDFQGLAEFTCKKCGNVKEVVIYALEGHTLTDVELTAPTCENDGTQMKEGYTAKVTEDGKIYGQTCEICEWQNWEEAKATGHKYEKKTAAATCKAAAEEWEECAYCANVINKKEVGAADVNAHVTEVLTTPATCEKDGVKVTVCTLCDKELGRVVLLALGHNIDDIPDHEILPLCQKDGTYIYKCSNEGCDEQRYTKGQLFDAANPKHHGLYRQDGMAYEVNLTLLSKSEGYSCENGGTLKYKCNVCSPRTDKESPADVTFNVVVPAKSHINADAYIIDALTYPTQCGESFTVDADFACSMCDFSIKAGTYTTKTTEHNWVKTAGNAPFCAVTYECDCVITIVDAEGNEVAVASKCTAVLKNEIEHSYKTVGERDAACELYGYRYVSCEYCYDAMYIDNYAFATGHEWEEVEKAPTCTEAGSIYEQCKNCDAKTTITEYPALGHVDKDGNVIYMDGCCVVLADGTKVPMTEDFVCVRGTHCNETCEFTDDDEGYCTVGHTIAWHDLHDWAVTVVSEATCNSYRYELHVCKVCETNHEHTDFQLGEKHTFDLDGSDWSVKKEATYKAPGLKEYRCANYENCKGTTDVEYTLDDVKVALNAYSGIKAGADVVNSGVLKVDVLVSAYDVKLHSVDMNIKYDSTKLEYVGFDVSDALEIYLTHEDGTKGTVEVGTAIENNIGIYVSHSVLADFALTAAEDVVWVTLTFNVKADTNEATSGVTSTTLTILDDVSVLKAEGTDKVETNLVDTVEEVKIQTLGNVTMATIESSTNNVDDFDGRALVALMMETENPEYVATADINKDGVIDFVDYAALAKYLAAGCTYAELCANDIAE